MNYFHMNISMIKRTICIVIHNRANYARIKSVMNAIKKRENLKLQVILGSSSILSRFGNVRKIIESDGFEIDAIVYSAIEGENPTTMAKSTGLSIIELATHFENLKPDIVLTVADRYETLSTAVAASYMNIPLAHTQGGEVTGSIDENVRHAITKLSHIHFPATKRAYDFLIKLGEDSKTVFLTGCPSIDLLNNIDLDLKANFFKSYRGVGSILSEKQKYILVLQHPVTTEYQNSLFQINETLKAIKVLSEKIQIAWLWPNIDAGSDNISKGLRIFRENNDSKNICFFKNFSPEDYARLLKNSSCIVGNSSSGIREGAFLGVPCVNIGSRQRNRERSLNVIDVDYNSASIINAINIQLTKNKYKKNILFGDGNAGEKIVEILHDIKLNINKQLNYLN